MTHHYLFRISLLTICLCPMVSAQGKKGGGNTSSSSAASSQANAPATGSTAALESQMQAYGALDRITKTIAAKVCAMTSVNKPNGVVLIYDQTAFSTLQSYQAFIANRQLIADAYRTLLPKGANKELQTAFGRKAEELQALATSESDPDKKRLNQRQADEWKFKELSIGLSNTIDPISDATSLLSAIAIASNTESPGQITIPDSAAAVALTRDLKQVCNNPTLTVVYPPLYGKGSSSDYASADIRVELQTLHEIRALAHKAVDDANIKFLKDNSVQTTKSDKTGTAGNGTTEKTTAEAKGSTTIVGDPAQTAALTDINGIYDSFMNSLLQVNGTSGIIGSASVIQGYQLAALIKGTLDNEATKHGPWTDGKCTVNAKSIAWTGSIPVPALDAAGAIQIDYADGEKEQAYIVPEETTTGGATTGFYVKTTVRSEQNTRCHLIPWVQRPAHILLASVANAGGTERVHKNIWTALWIGDKITYSGGAVVSVSLWTADSTMPLYLDVLRYRAPYAKIKKPGPVDGVDVSDDAGDNLTRKQH